MWWQHDGNDKSDGREEYDQSVWQGGLRSGSQQHSSDGDADDAFGSIGHDCGSLEYFYLLSWLHKTSGK